MVSRSQPGFVSNGAITLVQGYTYNRGQELGLGQDILPTMCVMSPATHKRFVLVKGGKHGRHLWLALALLA